MHAYSDIFYNQTLLDLLSVNKEANKLSWRHFPGPALNHIWEKMFYNKFLTAAVLVTKSLILVCYG